MFYRYVAYTGRGGCSNGVEHGLLTLIPLIFGQPLTESERAEFDDAVLMFSNLPAPNDVYEKYSGSVLKAWFTPAGEKKFHDACSVLSRLVNKYLTPSGYSVVNQLRIKKIKEGRKVVYADDLQILEGCVDD